MNFALSFKRLLHFSAVILIILSWPACDPDMPPAPTCDDDVPTVNAVPGPCSPGIPLNFSNLSIAQEGVIPLIANFCATDYSKSRVFRLPSQTDISMAVYANFPGEVLVEVIGSNCEGNLPFLIECITVESVAEVVDLAVEASGADDILVRVVPIQTTEYVPGENPEDEISVLLIEDFDNPDTFNDIIVSCSGDRLQRLVISGPGGLGFDAAAALGLPISESCSCSNGDLLTVDVPYGIDLLTLRPRSRVRVSQALNDTSGLGIDFDLLLDVPTTTPQGYDPADDVYINSIEAELCYEPMVPGAASPSDPNSGVTVAFIDSGFDVQNWGEIFAQSTTFQGETPPCWQNAGFFFSQFGYNFLDGNGNVQDVNGHGTDVAATLLSNTPDFPLSVLHFKFFGDGQGSYFDALCASYVAAASGANILNWSWGFYETELPKSLGNLLINLQEQNVLAVAAAGNDSISIDADRLYPASASMLFDNVVAVTSYWYPSPINLEPRLTGFSNFSPSRVSAAAYATKQTPLINSPGLHSPAGTSISTPLLAQQFAEYWGQQRALGNAPGYNEVISTVFANLPDNAPELVQGVQDGRYLPVGCSDGDLPPP